MGDRIIIKSIEVIDYSESGGAKLYQIDLYNETRKEWYRSFIEVEELDKLLNRKGAKEQ